MRVSFLKYVRRKTVHCLSLITATHVLASFVAAQEPPDEPAPISDNSFLIEEAYNQEAGVIQHINAVQLTRGGEIQFTFTQEIPIFNQRHQFSYTLPAQRTRIDDAVRTHASGIGDIALNYRFQLVGNRRVAIAPRVSLLLPSGDEDKNLGTGGTGLQFNLPASIRVARHFVTHSNAGTTYTPHAHDASGDEIRIKSYNFGQSVVWLAKPRFNLLVEAIYNRTVTVERLGGRTRGSDLLINPGARWAYNFRNGLQIVPGVGVPFGVGASRGERGVFLYLSFEHPFKKDAQHAF